MYVNIWFNTSSGLPAETLHKWHLNFDVTHLFTPLMIFFSCIDVHLCIHIPKSHGPTFAEFISNQFILDNAGRKLSLLESLVD